MMRALSRNLINGNFPERFTGNNRIEMELELLHQTREIRKGIRSKYKFSSSRWKVAKELLKEESSDKCAYCEVNFSTVAYGDVEHYRPKSIYWWLAYCYLNYAASCQLCNQKYKGARFPIPGNRLRAPVIVRSNSTDTFLENRAGSMAPDPINGSNGMSFEDFRLAHLNERPLSLDPYLDDPIDYFAYEYDDELREVSIIALSPTIKEIAESCINLFGLNRKELKELRFRKLLNYRFLRQIIGSDPEGVNGVAAKNLIKREYTSKEAEFSGMFIYFEDRDIDPLPMI